MSMVTDDTRPTRYCNHSHRAIQALAGELARKAKGARDYAEACFLHVRDCIPFGMDLIRVKASETLAKGYGACFNKSLLLTALLRAGGVPARFCSVPVGRWFMAPYAGRACRLLNDPFHHCLVQVNLEGVWTHAEPTLDRPTHEALFRPMGFAWGIEWNSERQDRLYLEHLRGEPRAHEDIDEAIERNLGNRLPPAPITLALSRALNRRAWKRIGR